MPSTSVWPPQSEARYRAALGLTLLLGALAFAFIAVMFVASFVAPTEAVAPTHHFVSTGAAEDYAVGQQRYFADGDFWLVRQTDERYLAFRATDPRYWLGDSSVQAHQVEWLPNLPFYDAASRQMTNGWFRARGSGSVFAVDGRRVFGPSPRGLDEYPVSVSTGGLIVVDAAKNQLIRAKGP